MIYFFYERVVLFWLSTISLFLIFTRQGEFFCRYWVVFIRRKMFFRALHDQRLAAGPRQGQMPLTGKNAFAFFLLRIVFCGWELVSIWLFIFRCYTIREAGWFVPWAYISGRVRMVKGVCDVPIHFFPLNKSIGKSSCMKTDSFEFSAFSIFKGYPVSLTDGWVFFPKRNLFSCSRIQKSALVITSLKTDKYSLISGDIIESDSSCFDVSDAEEMAGLECDLCLLAVRGILFQDKWWIKNDVRNNQAGG